MEYSSEEEIAVCNLALIALPSYVIKTDQYASFDFSKLHEVSQSIKTAAQELSRMKKPKVDRLKAVPYHEVKSIRNREEEPVFS